MKGEFVPVVTEGMLDAAFGIGACEWDYDDAIRAALAHPDFRAQLRAWAAEEMRGLVAGEQAKVPGPIDDEQWVLGHNACRAETLANIERWEQQP